MKAYKTEINPTAEQKNTITQTMGACRFVYNLYIAKNKELYDATKSFLTAYTFSKWLNQTYIPENPDKQWLKTVSSKSIKKAITQAETAYKRFFKKKSKYPRFKRKHGKKTGMYFINAGLAIRRNKIKIPTIGWVQLKEFGYIPTKQKPSSGTITTKAGKFYVSVLFKENNKKQPQLNTNGIGIDLGLKEFAVLSNNVVFNNINKTEKVRKLNKNLKRRQRRLSKQLLLLKKKGGTATGNSAKNIDKSVRKVQTLYARLANIRLAYISEVVDYVAKTKPAYVSIEDLNIRGMLSNRHLAKAVASQCFYAFRTKLIHKCTSLSIPVRIVDRWYASSKTCSVCGHKHTGLKLFDRVFVCPNCAYTADRDFNASVNLCNTTAYSLA